MPRLSSFYGIVIGLYHREHGVPHFHAVYSGDRASIAIDTLEILGGVLPDRAYRMVREWAELHRGELMENWREMGTIVWPNGADVAPETLYLWATQGRTHEAA